MFCYYPEIFEEKGRPHHLVVGHFLFDAFKMPYTSRLYQADFNFVRFEFLKTKLNFKDQNVRSTNRNL
jgi:hypothetical protein